MIRQISAYHQPTIIIKGETFRHLQSRQYEPVSVYLGAKTVLRLGPTELITSEQAKHQDLLDKPNNSRQFLQP